MLLSGVLKNTDPSTQLYGDGLTAAISALLFANPGEGGADNWKGLAPWQLRRVVEYLDAHLPKRVALAHLAELAGLSQAHFNRAFKASTGMTRSPRPPALPMRCISGGPSGKSRERHRPHGATTGRTDHNSAAVPTNNRRIEQ